MSQAVETAAPDYAALVARIEALERRTRCLPAIFSATMLPPACLRLTSGEWRLVSVLFANSPFGVSPDDVFEAMYGGREVRPQTNTVAVMASRARKQLAPFGIKIQSRIGFGFYMTAESAAILRRLIENLPDHGGN